MFQEIRFFKRSDFLESCKPSDLSVALVSTTKLFKSLSWTRVFSRAETFFTGRDIFTLSKFGESDAWRSRCNCCCCRARGSRQAGRRRGRDGDNDKSRQLTMKVSTAQPRRRGSGCLCCRVCLFVVSLLLLLLSSWRSGSGAPTGGDNRDDDDGCDKGPRQTTAIRRRSDRRQRV